MRAIVNIIYGPPEVVQLKEIPKPKVGDSEVLIKIHATTVNRTDCGFRDPQYLLVRLVGGLFKPKRKILGSELAGEIDSIGKDVKSFKVGDKVFGLSCIVFGAHAEYISVKEKGSITTMPSNLKYEEVVALCEGPWLAVTMLRKMKVKNGDKILINGGSGSIGSSAVQLAKYFGADVTAVCGTKNIDLVKSLGADEVIDYQKEDFTRRNKTFDFVFDAVGKSSFFKCKKILSPGGKYISTELGFLAQNLFLPLITFFGGKKVKFPIPVDRKEDIIFFKELAEAGKLKPVIDRFYKLEQIVEAYKYVETGMKTGSVVITVTPQ